MRYIGGPRRAVNTQIRWRSKFNPAAVLRGFRAPSVRPGEPPADRLHRPRRTAGPPARRPPPRSEEHTSELQSLMRISYAVFCLKKKKRHTTIITFDKTTSQHAAQ